jgi:hypothetical protein
MPNKKRRENTKSIKELREELDDAPPVPRIEVMSTPFRTEVAR